MYELNQNGSWLRIDRKFNKPVNVYVDNMSEPSNNGLNIAILVEPQSIVSTKDFFINNCDKYNVILTHNQDALDNCKNAELFEFGSCWITNLDETENKNFDVSFLVGGKSWAEGHKLRHQVWDNQDKIKLTKKFYNSGNFPYNVSNHIGVIGDKKEPLFNSQYHICIENSREKNWFTEKLIDCLYTKTIPIYWGCPNISDWFDTDSFIIVNSTEEIIDSINNLDENYYNSKLESLNKNFELCKPFLHFHKRVNDKIEEIVNRYD